MTSEWLKRAKLRAAARRSLYVTVAAVLCWDKKPNKIADAPDVFKPSCEWAEQVVLKLKRGWGGDPRAHTKSTRWTQGLPFWLAIQRPHPEYDLTSEYDRAMKFMEQNPIIKGPDNRILIASWTAEAAINFSRWIKNRFESDRFVRWLFPELIPEAHTGEGHLKWTDKAWTLPGRRQSYMEAFVETAGISTQSTSKHFDVIIIDDPVVEDNYKSVVDMQTLVNWFEIAPKLLNQRDRFAPDASVILGVGNHWTDFDLRAYIEENHPEFDVWHRSCWQCAKCGVDRCVRGPDCRPTNKPLWYTNWTPEGLAAEKAAAIKAGKDATKIWYAQMENDPQDPETVLMTQEDIIEFVYDPQTHTFKCYNPADPSEVVRTVNCNELYWYMACDPANSADPDACFTAIGHFGEDSEGNQYFNDLWLAKVSAEDGGAARMILDAHDEVHKTFPTYKLGIEAIAGQRYILPLLSLMARQRGNTVFNEPPPNNPNIVLFRTQRHRESKLDRIFNLLRPRAQERKLYVNRKVREKFDGAFDYQVFRCPNVRYLDIPDMWAWSQTLMEARGRSRWAEVNKRRIWAAGRRQRMIAAW